MRAQVLHAPSGAAGRPLVFEDRPDPVPGDGEVRVRVHTCGCCRTDLHVVEGDLELPILPIVPGHQVVGTVDALGPGCTRLQIGARVGVAWLHWACGVCPFCRRGEENLCERARFTGWTVDGGYADALTVPEDFAVHLPEGLSDLEAAPLLCAGVIGYRALRRAEVHPGDRVALMGFGASAHLVLQLLEYWGCEVVVLTRGERHRALARDLGAVWVGDAAELPPAPCDRVVVFAPAGELVPVALQLVRPGGVVSLAGIHMSPIPTFDYSLLWRERTLRSVANMTRRDAEEFMAVAAEAGIRAEVEPYSLEDAGEALLAIAHDDIRGAAVLTVS
ncbi:MAG TPA: zinc-dependent alcohol dehydrogenase family protein [Acidimicrobiia bacterium]|nr:zinc-dependent alcohol dehydrogenase family protein [Acidimicrobiia bacterium]